MNKVNYESDDLKEAYEIYPYYGHTTGTAAVMCVLLGCALIGIGLYVSFNNAARIREVLGTFGDYDTITEYDGRTFWSSFSPFMIGAIASFLLAELFSKLHFIAECLMGYQALRKRSLDLETNKVEKIETIVKQPDNDKILDQLQKLNIQWVEPDTLGLLGKYMVDKGLWAFFEITVSEKEALESGQYSWEQETDGSRRYWKRVKKVPNITEEELMLLLEDS